MPYTPPAQRSPVASKTNSPPRSRHVPPQTTTETQVRDKSDHGSRPPPPNSAPSKSYIHKHRRSPSVSKSAAAFTEPPTSERPRIETPCEDDAQGKTGPSAAIRSRNLSAVKANETAVKNPTSSGSPHSSSDDELSEHRGRTRDVDNLAELQAAIRNIDLHRESSPVSLEEQKKSRLALDMPVPRLDPAAHIDGTNPLPSSKPPLSASARKISHSRSSTDASAFLDFPRNKGDSPAQSASDTELDEADEEDLLIKPSLIRKKSGELVRPALRASSTKRRPSSMPGTPTYSKAVHFQESSLEHVRHFLQVDRPIAVSAGSSPVESYDEDTEFPFSDPDSRIKSPSYEWELKLTNFHPHTIERSAWPVRTEKVYLSPDTRMLLGGVAVRNLSFDKLVVARFTLDYWKTTSEVVAEYDNDIRITQVQDGYDRFTFNIKLGDQANLESKTMFFCVRYNVGGQEYWDNNNSINYQVDFSKKYKPQNGKQRTSIKNTQGPSALPRSNPSQQRPRSMPSFDDFSSTLAPYDFSTMAQPNAMVGDTPIRFKNRPSGDVLPDAPGKPKSTANQQAFGNRYDFGASLSAAIQAASTPAPKVSPLPESSPFSQAQSADKAGRNIISSPQREKADPIHNASKPTALTKGKPALQSSSYHELLDKYCFFGSGRPSVPQPQDAGSAKTAAHGAQVNGSSETISPPSDGSPASNTMTGSSSPSPPSSTASTTTEEKQASAAAHVFTSPRPSRTASPAARSSAMGSRSHSPGFGYPYHQGMQTGLFEASTATAIRG